MIRRNFLVTAETEGDSDETPSCPPHLLSISEGLLFFCPLLDFQATR